jgi:hypothetical protein
MRRAAVRFQPLGMNEDDSVAGFEIQSLAVAKQRTARLLEGNSPTTVVGKLNVWGIDPTRYQCASAYKKAY